MDCRCIACILSGKEAAVFNYPHSSPIKTHDYVILQQSASESLVCETADSCSSSEWEGPSDLSEAWLREAKSHDHHCPPWRAGQSCSFVCRQHWPQEVGGSAYLCSVRLN